MQLTGRREPILMSGAWQGRAASYYARGLVLFAMQPLLIPAGRAGLGSGASFAEHAKARLSEATAFAMPLSLLDFPKSPYRRSQQRNHHGQKQPCHIRNGKTIQHHLANAIA
jgi:hypothetical protein